MEKGKISFENESKHFIDGISLPDKEMACQKCGKKQMVSYHTRVLTACGDCVTGKTKIAELERENFEQSDLIAKLEGENLKLKQTLDFFGIEISEEGEISYKPSRMEKWRKAHNETENALLRNKPKEILEELENLDFPKSVELGISGRKFIWMDDIKEIFAKHGITLEAENGR